MINQAQSPKVKHGVMIEQALSEHGAARNAVMASWQRSRHLHNLCPHTQAVPNRIEDRALAHHRERMGEFLATAQPFLDRLFMAVGNSGCCILLSDTDGIPVSRRGATQDDETFERWGLWTGTNWSERDQGTNGIGTCLIEKRAVVIHKDQHYRSSNIALSCIAAPIFDHEGKLTAAIDLSSCRADLTNEFVGLLSMAVLDAAKNIEIEHFRNSYPEAQIVFSKLNQNRAEAQNDRQGTALLAVDRSGIVVGATRRARRYYDLDDGFFKNPTPLPRIYQGETGGALGFDDANAKTIRAALATSGWNVSQAANALGVSRSTLHRKMKKYGIDRGA